jgi:hypothetical protein
MLTERKGGERMNKKILGIVVAFMAVAMLATPVIAVTPKKVAVTIATEGSSWFLGEAWTIKGGTYHNRGSSLNFSTYKIMINGEDFLVGHSYTTCIDNLNIQNLSTMTGKGNQHFDSTIVFQDGTFEGITNNKGIFRILQSPPQLVGFMASVDIVSMRVYHGTGAYLGWTLVIETASHQPVAGYLLMP